jgi:hypothetical protein
MIVLVCCSSIYGILWAYEESEVEVKILMTAILSSHDGGALRHVFGLDSSTWQQIENRINIAYMLPLKASPISIAVATKRRLSILTLRLNRSLSYECLSSRMSNATRST